MDSFPAFTMGGIQGIEEWMANFEVMAALKKLDDMQRKQWCFLKLGPRSQAVIGDLQQEEDWQEVKGRVILKLGGRDPKEKAREQLSQMKKGDRTWEQVAHEVLMLVEQAYRGLDEKTIMAETVSRIQRMVPPQIERVVFRRQYTELSDLVNQIVREETYEVSSPPLAVNAVKTDDSNNIIEAIKAEGREIVAAMRRPPPRPLPPSPQEWVGARPPPPQRLCFACHRPGHLVARCPLFHSFLAGQAGRGRGSTSHGRGRGGGYPPPEFYYQAGRGRGFPSPSQFPLPAIQYENPPPDNSSPFPPRRNNPFENHVEFGPGDPALAAAAPPPPLNE